MMDSDHGHSRGLAGSRWAPNNYSTPSTPNHRSQNLYSSRSVNTSPTRKEPLGFGSDWDWDCSSCGFSNFGWRKECMRCQADKGDSRITLAGGGGRGENVAPSRTNGSTLGLQPVQGKTLREATNAQIPSMQSIPQYAPEDENATAGPRGALAMSRWAPRNRVASQKYGDKIWTKVIHHSNPLASATNSTLPQPDLGLPYEVQHYILHLLQTILEEGCFAIASRWLPAELAAKRWSCSEAVELAAWRDFLPQKLPHTALQRSGELVGISLEQGLQDAVKIRNKAVHRHLVDNTELRGLCWKGERLMMLFGDLSRREKCARLQLELDGWDREAARDQDGARRVLEMALVEIGERPMADMDWTPNEVSLLLVKDEDGGNGTNENGGAPGHVHVYESEEDAMDLD